MAFQLRTVQNRRRFITVTNSHAVVNITMLPMLIFTPIHTHSRLSYANDHWSKSACLLRLKAQWRSFWLISSKYCKLRRHRYHCSPHPTNSISLLKIKRMVNILRHITHISCPYDSPISYYSSQQDQCRRRGLLSQSRRGPWYGYRKHPHIVRKLLHDDGHNTRPVIRVGLSVCQSHL